MRTRRDEALDRELQFHVDERVAELVAAGVPLEDARRQARLEFGGVMQVKEACRDERMSWAVVGLWHDLRLAVRALRVTPVVTVVAILSLALGIGASTAIFSIVNSLVFRTLAVRDPARLVGVTDAGFPTRLRAWSYPIWEQIHARTELVDATAAWSFNRFDTASGGEKQLVDGMWASGSFFETLGVPAAIGRTFSEADDRPGGGADGPVAVISDRFWQRRFGGAIDVVGRSLTLDSVPFTIIGVTPPGFHGLDVGRAFDVIVPVATEALVRGRDSVLASSSSNFLSIVARLRAGQSADAATRGLRDAQSAIRSATLADLAGPTADRFLTDPLMLSPVATGVSDLRERYQRPLVTILGIVGVLLLIACANIANLLMARAIARRHELSLRIALGASRWRLMRQLLAESTLLSVIGAVSGLAIARWLGQLLVRQLSTTANPIVLDLAVDGRVLAFTVAVTTVTTLIFGVSPAVRATRVAPIDALKDQGRAMAPHSQGSLAGWLVVAQVALSVVLIVAAGLFVRTFQSLANRPLGFQPDRVLVVIVDAQRSAVDATQRVALFDRARDAVRSLPDVEDAAVSFLTPVTGAGLDPAFEISGIPFTETQRRAVGNLISPRWFHTFGTPMVAGRDFSERDRAGAPRVAIVNEAFARRFLGGASPIGRTMTLYAHTPAAMSGIEIVGVAADAVYNFPRDPVPPTWYLPNAQFDRPGFSLKTANLSVRLATRELSPLTKGIASALVRVDPRLALTFRTLSDRVDASLTQERVIARLAEIFGVLALLLAGVGLYGVTAYAVSRRRGEIGVRMALGAARGSVVRLILSRVSLLVGGGILVGAALSVWASTFVASLLYGVDPRDPAVILIATVTLAVVGLAAGWVPAARAARIDPAEVLRAH